MKSSETGLSVLKTYFLNGEVLQCVTLSVLLRLRKCHTECFETILSRQSCHVLLLLHTKRLELQLTCRGTDALNNNITAALENQSKLQFMSQDGQELKNVRLNKGKGVKKEINSDALVGSSLMTSP